MNRRPILTGLLCLALTRRAAALPAPSPAATPQRAMPELVMPELAMHQLAIAGDLLQLQEAMVREVPGLLPRTPARDAEWVALARAETAAAAFVVEHPQLLVVVDRSPRIQQLALILAMPADDWLVVGGTKVSTGAMGRWDHYVTPCGVFRITDAILGFRAEGTVNENGIRGLGAKGMRVWDFGWHVAMKGWPEAPGRSDRTPIRLMMHATDPTRLEQRIGRPASQGCIRIPSALNRFLDQHGVLDAEYERAAVTDIRFRTLLPRNRTPTALAGTALIVVETPDPPQPPPQPSSQPPPRPPLRLAVRVPPS